MFQSQMYKRTISLTCAMLAIIAITTACSGKEGQTADSSSAQKGSLSATVYDRGLIPASEGTMEKNRWTKWINENGPANVTFVAVPRTESKQKLNTLFASGSAPDLIFEFEPSIKNPLYDQKQLMPIDDMINNYSTVYKKLIEENPALKQASIKSDGKMYEFGKLNEAIPQNIAVIRQDWLEKLNLNAPQTTEELYQVAKAFAENDPDGNGKKDTYGLNIGAGLSDVFGGGSLNNSYVDVNGELVRQWDNHKYHTEFVKHLFDEGIIDKDFITDNNGAKARQDFLNGKTGIYFTQANTSLWSRLWVADYATLKANVPGAELAILPYPKSPLGQYINWINNPVQMTAVVNRSAKDPKAIMEYIDFLSTPDTGRTLTSGLEGVHWNNGAGGCPNAIDPEKNKTETGYLGQDYNMVFSVPEGGKCFFIAGTFNVEKPEEKLAKDMFKANLDIFYDLIDQQANWPGLTHSEHLPSVPQELLVDLQNAGTEIPNIFKSAMVSGSSYTVDQAMADAQATWDKYNGQKIDAFYQQWYSENKDTILMPTDIFSIVNDQKKLQEDILK